jgi:hypothetical protein
VGGNAQLIDHIGQALLGMGDRGAQLARAHTLRQLDATGTQVGGFHPPAAQHQQQRHAHIGRQKPRRKRQVHGQHPP